MNYWSSRDAHNFFDRSKSRKEFFVAQKCIVFFELRKDAQFFWSSKVAEKTSENLVKQSRHLPILSRDCFII